MPTEVALAVLLRDGAVLLQRRARPPGAGAWELPGGKLRPGEGALRGAAREAEEELGVPVRALRALDVQEHRYPGGPRVRLHAVLCEALRAVPDAPGRAWFPLAALPPDVLEGTRPVLARCAATFPAPGGGGGGGGA